MGTLCYSTSMSLDGYVADASGDFQWAAPSEEIFDFHVQRMSDVSTEVLGRKTFELMKYWEAEPEGETWTDQEREFAALWADMDHVVVSSTLTPEDIASPRVRLTKHLNLEELDEIVASVPGRVEIFGPTTAAEAIRAGKVREFQLFVVPKLVGGGLRALPDGVNLDLDLAEHRVFDGGTTFLRYVAR